MHNRLVANVLRMRAVDHINGDATDNSPDNLTIVNIRRAKPGTWGQLAAPIRAGDNQNIARAHSYLLNWVKDSSGLTPEEALDVVRWMDQKGIK